jgi:hypothetical protein
MAVEAGRLKSDPVWHSFARFRLLAAVLAVSGYVLTLFLFYPGHITIDAQYVYEAARTGGFGDWQSPAMALLWRLIDPLAPGAPGMFLLIATLYWCGFTLVAMTVLHRAARADEPGSGRAAPARSRAPSDALCAHTSRELPLASAAWLGIAALLLALAPPAFFFLAVIWRDVLFGTTWLAAAALAFATAERAAGVRIPAQALALGLVAFGVLLRPNAIAAAAVLAAYVLWPLRFALRRAALVFMPAVALFYALVPAVYYGALDARRQNPLHSVLVFDLGGITHFTGENQFPVSWSPEQMRLLNTTCYDPVRWDTYWHMSPCPFVMERLEQADDPIFGTPRLAEAWRRAIITHPLAYLAHRAAFMWQFLARSNLALPVLEWENPDATYGRSSAFRRLLALHAALQPTLLFRPGLWLVLAAAILAAAWPRRASAAGAFAVGVGASAVTYVLTFSVVGVAADFRYAYWCVLATLAGAVAAAAARRPAANPGAGFTR